MLPTELQKYSQIKFYQPPRVMDIKQAWSFFFIGTSVFNTVCEHWIIS